MIINNIEEIRIKAHLTKTEMAKTLGMSRVTYYKVIQTGNIDDSVVYDNYDIFGIEKPADYYKYTSESLRASIAFYGLIYNDFAKLWGEEYSYSVMRNLALSHKNLYYLKELFDATFHPIIVPCEMLDDGSLTPVLTPNDQLDAASEDNDSV